MRHAFTNKRIFTLDADYTEFVNIPVNICILVSKHSSLQEETLNPNRQAIFAYKDTGFVKLPVNIPVTIQRRLITVRLQSNDFANMGGGARCLEAA